MVLGDGIRRDIMTISPEEQRRFVKAIKQLNQPPWIFPGKKDEFPAGGVSYWFKQDEIHQATHVHGGPAFLPWHRELCNRFEQLLRMVDRDLSLHYWNWNTDPAPLFTEELMGSAKGDAGEAWKNAKFYNPTPELDSYRDDNRHSLEKEDPRNSSTWKYPKHSNPADPPKSLTRNKSPGAPRVGQRTGGIYWPTDSELVNAKTYQDFNDLMQGNETGTSSNGAHALAHDYIGGNLAAPNISFRDPFVFLLHSNVDRLWAMWQSQNPERLDPTKVYGSEGSTSPITDSLQPWAGTGVWPARPWFTPENQQLVKTCKDPSIVLPPLYDTSHPPTVYSIKNILTARGIPLPVSIRNLGGSNGLTPPFSVITLMRRLA